jgi:co-chaperonin GroES (HSP10)
MRILNNSVLIEPLKKVERSPGGIWFDLNQNDDEKLWRVVACGPGRTVKKKGKPPVLIPMEVAPGDRVLVDVALGC